MAEVAISAVGLAVLAGWASKPSTCPLLHTMPSVPTQFSPPAQPLLCPSLVTAKDVATKPSGQVRVDAACRGWSLGHAP